MTFRSKRNKYGNSKCEADDGIRFDSRKERSRYYELRAMQKAGMISGLELQKTYTLIPNQYEGKKCVMRCVKYKADFAYYDEFGSFVVEDVKPIGKDGKPIVTKEYTIKKKLMFQLFGILIREV